MSLLLDALKKAEKAKEEARRRSQAAPDSAADDTIIQVQSKGGLPEISNPLDLHSDVGDDDFSNQGGSPVPDAFSTAPVGRATAPSPPQFADTSSETGPSSRDKVREAEKSNESLPSQRAAAKNVFEAKFREPNPKLPFYITMALLGAFAVGTVIYFWYQLRPPPPLVNTNAKPPPDEKKIEASSAPASVSALPAQAAVASAPIAGLPAEQPPQSSAAASLPGRAPEAAPPKPPASATGAPPRSVESPPARSSQERIAQGTAPRRANAARPDSVAPEGSKLSINRPKNEVNPKLEAGWLAYNQGDMRSARSHYQEMLKEDSANRDALLGMAAIEVRANRLEQAAGYYQSVLQGNPRDPYAQAGLLALRAQVSDPVQTESKVKSLLASDPEAQVLHFSLGNQYAQQGRWPEAQQSYFKAFSADPTNPDFAYNLAVSLDQVHQPKLALDYYRRALSLAQQRSGNFDQSLARARIAELAK